MITLIVIPLRFHCAFICKPTAMSKMSPYVTPYPISFNFHYRVSAFKTFNYIFWLANPEYFITFTPSLTGCLIWLMFDFLLLQNKADISYKNVIDWVSICWMKRLILFLLLCFSLHTTENQSKHLQNNIWWIMSAVSSICFNHLLNCLIKKTWV